MYSIRRWKKLIHFEKKSLHFPYAAVKLFTREFIYTVPYHSVFDDNFIRRRWRSTVPNIKSSAKRDQLAKARNAKNKAEKSALKTAVKKFDAAVAEGNKDAAVSTYKVAVKAVDKAAGKNLIHKNNSANKKSKMTHKLNSME